MAILLPEQEFCWFCRYIAGEQPCAFVLRNEQIAAWINIRQYERGSMLIAPTTHLPTVFDLDANTLAAVYTAAARVGEAAVRAFEATGLNIFQNNGVFAGQTVAHHHVHVVPRYASSDPRRLFHADDYEPVAWEEQLALARDVRAALGELAAN
jgi:histidine triad (HIT) family protein